MATISSELTRIKDILDATNISVTDEIEIYEYVANLQEENKHLDKVNCHLRKKINNDIYKSRNEKAIEYIEQDVEINKYSRSYLLDILGGKDNDTNDIYRNNT